MAGFSDLVGRNRPSLGVNKATYVAGDTWKDTIGPFTDSTNTIIDLSAATVTITILDKVGGTTIATITGSGTVTGMITFTVAAATTAGYTDASVYGARRSCVWNCTITLSSQTVTVWSAVESPLTILAD